MSSIVTLNGTQYVVPAYNDSNWAQGTGNLSQYLVAIASNTLQPTGGAFTLTSELDFGANFGVKSLYLKTETANPSTTGVIRLASTDTLKWRNNANSADIALSKTSGDLLQFNGTNVITAGTGLIVNADVSASAAIAYSKLALTGSILNADLAGSITYSKLILTGAILNADLAGSIAYSKLTLTGSIVNADVNTSAAIAVSKLAAMTTGRDTRSDSNGFLAVKPLAVQATTATPATVSSGTFTNTNLSATITPSSSTARIRVTVSGSMQNSSMLTTNTFFTIARGSTNLAGAGGFTQFGGSSAASGSLNVPVAVTYIDSPATGSAVTYNAQIRTQGSAGNVIFPADSSNTAVMTLEEVS